jgi:hypothetical protein
MATKKISRVIADGVAAEKDFDLTYFGIDPDVNQGRLVAHDKESKTRHIVDLDQALLVSTYASITNANKPTINQTKQIIAEWRELCAVAILEELAQ